MGRWVFGLVVSLLAGATCAQAIVYRGEVDYPYLGIRLVIPAGWYGTTQGEYLLLGSDTEPGLLALTLNEATQASQLKAVADQGISDDGVALQRSSDFRQIGAEGLGAEFTGMFQGQAAKAFIAGIINPFGNSVTALALTSKDKYGKRQPALIMEIARSIKFAQPKEGPFNQKWREALVGRKLTYMKTTGSSDTYYDAGGYAYSSYSGYSSRTVIHLCANRQFARSSSSHSSFDARGGFGHVHSRGANRGQWQIGTSADGESLLQLTGNDGREFEYRLKYEKGKTMLNGTRYFRTDSELC